VEDYFSGFGPVVGDGDVSGEAPVREPEACAEPEVWIEVAIEVFEGWVWLWGSDVEGGEEGDPEKGRGGEGGETGASFGDTG
jgi:hypothetical protein